MSEKPKDQIVILADVSPSMADADGGNRERKTRFQLLLEALQTLPQGVLIITFAGAVREVRHVAEVQIDPNGSTALHAAIDAAARHKPVRTIIVSDGEPDSEPLARSAVDNLTGIVDVVFCGNPSNVAAKAFLESLAKSGAGGFYETGDQVEIDKQLPAVIAGLLNS
jgi:hypothetical protein